ncbi:MAG: hypothetical protein E7374_01880 [Clostridiales bacterium]|nr:hypothetical protein [Clostridiales bacterium]
MNIRETYKLDPKNYAQLDLLISTFFEIIEYKRGRGDYGNRVSLKRSALEDNDRIYEFFYLDANTTIKLPASKKFEIQTILKQVISPAKMNKLCNFDANVDPAQWAIETRDAIVNAKTLDYAKINEILNERYAFLGPAFMEKLQEHRELQYKIAREMGLIPPDYGVGFTM